MLLILKGENLFLTLYLSLEYETSKKSTRIYRVNNQLKVNNVKIYFLLKVVFLFHIKVTNNFRLKKKEKKLITNCVVR